MKLPSLKSAAVIAACLMVVVYMRALMAGTAVPIAAEPSHGAIYTEAASFDRCGGHPAL